MTCKDCMHYEYCEKVYMYTILQRVCSVFKKKEALRECKEDAWNESGIIKRKA